MDKLDQGLRNYILKSSISLHLIDFEKSQIKEKEEYQILYLRKPNPAVLEIETLIEFGNPKLLVFNTKTQENFLVELKITSKDSESGKEKEYLCWGDQSSFAMMNGYLILKSMHIGEGSINLIAIFDDKGNFISSWQLDAEKVFITNLKRLNSFHFLLSYEIIADNYNRNTRSDVCLLATNETKVRNLKVRKENIFTDFSLADSNFSEIKCWFSSSEENPKMFVLASPHHLCVYVYDYYGNAGKFASYDKIFETKTIEHIKDLEVLPRKYNEVDIIVRNKEWNAEFLFKIK